MKQRGRKGKDITMTLHADKINVKGKKIELEPLVERIRPILSRIPGDVSAVMGIPFIPNELEIKLFDDKRYKTLVTKESGDVNPAFYVPRGKNVYVNIEGTVKNFNWPGFDLEYITQMAILCGSWHEIAHMNHYFYDPKIFKEYEDSIDKFFSLHEKRDELLKLSKEGKYAFKTYGEYLLSFEYYRRVLRYLAIIESVAQRTDLELMRKYMNDSKYESQEIPENCKKAIKKIKLSHDDGYSFSYWFMNKISKMTDANVIRLSIQHNPTYVEMLYPELYIIRMRVLGLI